MTFRHLFRAVYLGFGVGGVLIIIVFLTGNTFGQRCAKLWPENSSAWNDCVEQFAHGRHSDQ
jgi:hypothetical protein